MGNIQAKEYYNKAYIERDNYKVDYKESEYYELWKIILKVIKPYKDSNILELGCGTGQFAKMINDEGYTNYIGIDFSDKAIEIASGYDINFKIMDILNIDKLNYNYDVVVALEVFEHTHDLKVISLLKPKTPIVFTLPDFDDPAHERHFKSEDGIKYHYEGFIDFKTIQKHGKYFICNGVIK